MCAWLKSNEAQSCRTYCNRNKKNINSITWINDVWRTISSITTIPNRMMIKTPNWKVMYSHLNTRLNYGSYSLFVSEQFGKLNNTRWLKSQYTNLTLLEVSCNLHVFISFHNIRFRCHKADSLNRNNVSYIAVQDLIRH